MSELYCHLIQSDNTFSEIQICTGKMAKRTRITRPYPTHSFQDALPIADTIQRVNGGQPVETELLAEALGTSVKSSTFVQKLNASSKYGMTVGLLFGQFH